MKKFVTSTFIISVLLPVSVFAAQLTNTESFFKSAQRIITSTLIPLVFVLALLYFFWGVGKYIRSVSPGGKEEGKTIMIWGVVALFVMSSVWGIVRFIQSELGIDRNTNMQIPGFGGDGSNTGNNTSGNNTGDY